MPRFRPWKRAWRMASCSVMFGRGGAINPPAIPGKRRRDLDPLPPPPHRVRPGDSPLGRSVCRAGDTSRNGWRRAAAASRITVPGQGRVSRSHGQPRSVRVVRPSANPLPFRGAGARGHGGQGHGCVRGVGAPERPRGSPHHLLPRRVGRSGPLRPPADALGLARLPCRRPRSRRQHHAQHPGQKSGDPGRGRAILPVGQRPSLAGAGGRPERRLGRAARHRP